MIPKHGRSYFEDLAWSCISLKIIFCYFFGIFCYLHIAECFFWSFSHTAKVCRVPDKKQLAKSALPYDWLPSGLCRVWHTAKPLHLAKVHGKLLESRSGSKGCPLASGLAWCINISSSRAVQLCTSEGCKCIEFISGGSSTNLDAILATEGYSHLEVSSPSVFIELLKAAHRNKRRRSPGDSWIAVYGFLAYIVHVLFIFISFQKHTVSLLFSSLKDGVNSGSCWLLL